MKKIIQIMPANGEYEAVFFSYDTGDLFTDVSADQEFPPFGG
jgi:hypothetical protein